MEKICLSQNNFDKLLHLALSNCQSKDIRPHNRPNRMSFFNRRPGTNSGEDKVIVINPQLPSPPQPYPPLQPYPLPPQLQPPYL